MTLFEEGLLAMRGCWRLICRDPAADEDFNLTMDGFWRSFAMILPAMLLAYPLFVLDNRFAAEFATANNSEQPAAHLGWDYFNLLAGLVLWLIAAALLARFFNTGQTYARYMIMYNWMTLPILIISLVPYVFYLLTGALSPTVILAHMGFFFLLYLSWYSARYGLQTTSAIALAFPLVEGALAFGLDALIR